MSSCDYELHFEDKDSAEQNGVNGTGTQLVYPLVHHWCLPLSFPLP